MVELCIVGGGLAGSLAAWRHHQVHPARRLCLIEADPRLGGNHTWSFHATDLPPPAQRWMAPLVVARWPRYRVLFRDFARTVEAEYCTTTSERLHAVVAGALGDAVTTGTAAEVSANTVRLTDGRTIEAHVVIDARGGGFVPDAVGWQTFLGQEIECARPHGLAAPMLMDATVPQAGAFKFMYVLPFSPTRLLVEDTAYADTSDIDVDAARAGIAAYATAHGWPVREVIREEVGRLPIPLGGRIESYWAPAVTAIGVRAGLFHPTTGYSLPDAVATADRLAAVAPFAAQPVHEAVRRMAVDRWRQRAFFRLLNRWLFRGAPPEGRADLLAHFYSRPEPTIARFYAARLTTVDRIRMLAGRPPIPLRKALAHLRE
jgi:lycopene beta-cyclase